MAAGRYGSLGSISPMGIRAFIKRLPIGEKTQDRTLEAEEKR